MAELPSVYRYEVPVDDRWHTHFLSGAVLHVGGRRVDTVEIWVLNSGGPELRREFRAFGTGQPLPSDCGRHVGTIVHHQLVWHLFERDPR